MAYFIVVQQQNPAFDPFVNGKTIARRSRQLNRIATQLGLPELESFVSYSEDDMEAMREEAGVAELPAWYEGEQWHEPKAGLAWVNAVRQHLEANPDAVRNVDAVLAELREYQNVLEQAEQVDTKWHLAVDY